MIEFGSSIDPEVEVREVLDSCLEVEGISRERFCAQVLLDPGFRSEGLIVAREGARTVGFALVGIRGTEEVDPHPSRAYLWLFGVLPSHQRLGIGMGLVARAEAYAREQGRTEMWVSAYSSRYFTPGVDVARYPEALEFLSQQGYGEVYRPLAMETALWDLQRPGWLLGCSARLEREMVKPVTVLEFARREFGGDWERYIRESYRRQLDGDRRTGVTAAWDGRRVVGVAHFEGERFGPIGVDSRERGRGLGQALMWDVLKRQRDLGYRTSWFLWSDDRTAERLYANAGFREVRRFAIFKKVLA